MKHDARFWRHIEARYGNYKDLEKELSVYWYKISERISILDMPNSFIEFIFVVK
jgi:predicted metal-dependent hydrolase